MGAQFGVDYSFALEPKPNGNGIDPCTVVDDSNGAPEIFEWYIIELEKMQ